MKTESIIKFLKEHPLISINGLEKDCKLSQGTISKAVKGERRIKDKNVKKIAEELGKYGL